MTRWIGSALLVLIAVPAAAQHTSGGPWYPGALGGGVASGLYAPSPRTVIVQGTSAVALVLDAASLSIAGRLRSGSVRGAGGATITRPAQSLLLGVVEGGEARAARELAGVLARSGVPVAATRLADELLELLSLRRPDQLSAAIRRFDELVRKAEPRFLAEPPPEFLAVHAVLSELATVAAQAQ